MIKKIASISLLLLFNGVPISFAAGTEISSGLDRLTRNLVSSYRKEHPVTGKEKIAVFKFNTTKELEKKRIGFAVSELLTHHLVSASDFTVVERIELSQILKELRINMSGVTDPEDALRAGKLGGAKLLVLGGVEKIGAKYHVNARMVEVETGQVVSTAYETFLVSTFEEDARDYVVYVPETQRIGVYLLYNWRYNPNRLPNSTTLTDEFGNPVRTVVHPRSFSAGLAGLGVRYSPFRNIVVDASQMRRGSGQKPRAGYVARWVDYGSSVSDTSYNYAPSISGSRFLISLKRELFRKFYWYAGAGATYYKIWGVPRVRYATPAVQLRGEYFPQDRVGISLSVNYDFVSKTIRQGLVLEEKAKRLRLSKFSIEPALSIYF